MDVEKEIEKLKERVTALEDKIDKFDKSLLGGPTLGAKAVSDIESFLQEVGDPSSYNKEVLAFAYWLYRHQDVEGFNKHDMEGCFREARLPVPSDVSVPIASNLSKEYVMKTGQEKDDLTAYVISSKGEKVVEGKFEDY